MLILSFDKNNYINLGNLIAHGKKVFLLCYTNHKSNIDLINEWELLQALKKYILSDDIILAKFLVNTKLQLLKRFPRIFRTGKELPRIVYVDGLNSVTKYTDRFLAKPIINWIKNTLNITMDILAQENSKNGNDDINVREPRVTNYTIENTNFGNNYRNLEAVESDEDEEVNGDNIFINISD